MTQTGNVLCTWYLYCFYRLLHYWDWLQLNYDRAKYNELTGYTSKTVKTSQFLVKLTLVRWDGWGGASGGPFHENKNNIK